MSQAAKYGLPSGLRGIVGIQIGNLIFFLCISFGLVTLLAAATNAFVILQFAGAVYLLYLGFCFIISSLWRGSVEAASPSQAHVRTGSLVTQALLIQLTNPKALMFVSALLPQFFDPHGNVLFQVAILLSCTVVVDTAVLGAYALLADRGAQSLRRAGFSQWMRCTFGLALVASVSGFSQHGNKYWLRDFDFLLRQSKRPISQMIRVPTLRFGLQDASSPEEPLSLNR
jgi:homoserine/homoserine lactone efflux protein